MKVRTYGASGPFVIAIHGGPGASGHMAPVARGLADRFQVLEPWQRASGDTPLTVARHVEDLHELIAARCGGERPALLGSSWGAMLALAYAAAHPDAVGPLVLVGCGTFDRGARARLRATVQERMDGETRRRMALVSETISDLDERLAALGALTTALYSYDPFITDTEDERYDARAHQESWDDMVRLQEKDVYPAAFAAIRVPVLMLHGAYDPHPGAMIRASLEPYLPQLEYQEWERCGHYPWLERTTREEFFTVVREWLARHTGAATES